MADGKYSDKAVAVIGLGGLGCNIAVHLAGEGIGKLKLCDFDTVTEGNLNRQFFYTPRDISQSKVKKAAAFLNGYAPGTKTETYEKKIEKPSDLDFAKDCGMIMLAADNNAVRKTAAVFCAENGIPLVNGGINGDFGTAYLYVPGVSPCPACAGLTQTENVSPVSLSPVAGMIGALEAQLALSFLGGENRAGILYIYDAGTVSALTVKKKKNCKKCN